MNTKPLVVENLKKSFGKVSALRGVDLSVDRGEIFGLIGPDGAGKTTFIRIVVSLLNADEGAVYFQGKPVRENIAYVRSRIGYMPQRFSLYPDLTVEENLRFFGDLFGVPLKIQKERMERLYRFSRLGAFKDRRADALSGGMKQKLALSCMLMHEPEVIVMDEPTYGVDPVSRSELWEILRTLTDEGRTILVSTAYMDEAQLCDRVGLIFKGEVLAQGKPDSLLNLITDPLYMVKTPQPHRVYFELLKHFEAVDCNIFGNGVHVIDRHSVGAEQIAKILKQSNFDFDEITPIRPGIEDVFLKLIRTANPSAKPEQRGELSA
ncbi:MAG: ABC transporter ATP-binding protein [Calditrichaeota bacterium]|nr:ABC transporter ATP-binding protein [Calditrichota bacterium]